MSSALSSIRTRRTQPPPNTTVNSNGYINPNINPSGQVPVNQGPNIIPNAGTATLQQIIEIYGKRINSLETKVQQNQPGSSVTLPQVHDLIQSKLNNIDQSKELVKEWDTRFELIAQELADLKDIVLHLQDYTMSVNKILFDKLPDSQLSLENSSSKLDEIQPSYEVKNTELKNELTFTDNESSTYNLDSSFTTNKNESTSNDIFYTTKLNY